MSCLGWTLRITHGSHLPFPRTLRDPAARIKIPERHAGGLRHFPHGGYGASNRCKCSENRDLKWSCPEVTFPLPGHSLESSESKLPGPGSVQRSLEEVHSVERLLRRP